MVDYEIQLGKRTFAISYDTDKKTAAVDEKTYQVITTPYGSRVIVELDGKPYSVEVVKGRVTVNGEPTPFNIQRGKPKFLGKQKSQAAASGARIKPPMPGRIVSIEAKVGERVKRGQGLLVLEAMKMQNEVTAPVEGTVKAINVKPGQTVDANVVMVEIE